MRRVCFQLQVRPDRIDEYRKRHAAVWPDMLAALHETGWHNYSLFLRPDGLLVGLCTRTDVFKARRRQWDLEVRQPGWRPQLKREAAPRP